MAIAVIASIRHGSTSVLDYTLDWTDWLRAGEPAVSGDSISASEWTASDPSIPISGGGGGLPDATAFTQTVLGKLRWYTTVWVGPIPDGESITLTNRVTTQLGRVEECSIQLTGVDR